MILGARARACSVASLSRFCWMCLPRACRICFDSSLGIPPAVMVLPSNVATIRPLCSRPSSIRAPERTVAGIRWVTRLSGPVIIRASLVSLTSCTWLPLSSRECHDVLAVMACCWVILLSGARWTLHTHRICPAWAAETFPVSIPVGLFAAQLMDPPDLPEVFAVTQSVALASIVGPPKPQEVNDSFRMRTDFLKPVGRCRAES